MRANSSKSIGAACAGVFRRKHRTQARGIVAAVFAASVLCATAANAGVIYGGPVSSPTSFSGCQAASLAGDQSGLSSNYVSGVTDFGTFTASTTHTGGPCNTGFALSGGPGFGVFTMDMLGPVTVDALAFWAGDLGPVPGPASFRLYADGDANFFGGAAVTSLTAGPIPTAGLPGVFGFAATTSRYFHVLVFSQPGINQVSVGELALRGVPEPGTLALAGLSLIGLGVLQRRGKPTAAALEGDLA